MPLNTLWQLFDGSLRIFVFPILSDLDVSLRAGQNRRLEELNYKDKALARLIFWFVNIYGLALILTFLTFKAKARSSLPCILRGC